MKAFKHVVYSGLLGWATLLGAQEKISQLPAAGAVGGTEQIPCVQSGVTSKCTPAQIATYYNNLTANLANKKISPSANQITDCTACAADGVTNDTAALQAALNTGNFVELLAGHTYMVSNLQLATGVPVYGTNPTGGIFAPAPGATIKAINSGTATYLIATPNWVSNTTSADNPFYCNGITFDANSNKTSAFVDMSYGSVFEQCFAANGTSYGFYETGYTANSSQLTNTRENIQFISSGAYGNADGIYSDPGATNTPTDVQIRGGYWQGNSAYGIYAGSGAGWQISGIHEYSNTTADLYVNSYGYGTSITSNYFEGNVIINSMNSTSHTGVFGAGNSIGGTLQANFVDNYNGSSLRSLGNQYYTSSSTILNHFNGAGHPIYTEGDQFNTYPFQFNGGTGSGAQIWADHSTLTFGGSNGQSGPCEINGLILPTPNNSNQACTDFDIGKSVTSGTTIAFTIVVTIPNTVAAPPGYSINGTIEVVSNFTEIYNANVVASYVRQFNSSTVTHNAALQDATDSNGSPAVSCAITSVDTTVNSSGNNVETITITATIPTATNTYARLKFHSNNRNVSSIVVS